MWPFKRVQPVPATLSHHRDTPVFDKKYKTIVSVDVKHNYQEMIYWLNDNTRGSVDIKLDHDFKQKIKVYVGFENSDDALFFKIRFSI